MHRCLLLAVFALVACGAEDEPPVGPIGYDALHYDFSIDLATRAATSRVRFEVVEPGDCLSIPFRADQLGDVLLDGEPVLDQQLDGDVLTACGIGWDVGAEVELAAGLVVPDETWGASQVGFSVTDDLEGNPFTYMVGWVGGCDRFGPCDNAPADFARYRFEVAHAAGEQVLCPGAIDAGETRTICDFDHPGGPTYSTFALAANASWQVTDLGSWGGVRATLYDAPSTGTAARFETAIHAAFLQWMVDNFGPYPYGDELRFATAPTYWAGFEHPGNILLDDRLSAASTLSFIHTVNHEIAHQWAGDQTTLAGTYDFAWKEAMVEYLAFVYEDEQIAPSTALQSARSWRTGSQFAEYYLVPDERPPLLDYYGHVYSPGPLILFRQIEALFSRDAVFEALQSLLGAERAIGIADVQAALEDATGADLSGYFDTWVYGSGAPEWPRVDVTVTDHGDGSVTVDVDQVVSGDGYYGMAFFVRLTGDNAGEEHDVWIDFGVDGAATASADATPGFAVTGHVVDPLAHSLAQDAAAAAALPPRPAFMLPWGVDPPVGRR